jgi:4-hydroxy-2-oxoheptanedioate aldolase
MHAHRAIIAISLSAALATTAPGLVQGQGPTTPQFAVNGGVDGSHWSRLVNVAAAGKVIFGSFTPDKSPDSAVAASRNTLPDFWFYDMEHTPFGIETFRNWLQFTIDPAQVLRNGKAMFTPVMVRLPTNGREMNQWMIKQVLDQGAMGVIIPHVENAAQALNVVQASRYPHRTADPDAQPPGQRGSGAGNAVRFLGVPFAEYMQKADVYPLDPNGEIFNILLIENQEGVKNVREIAQVPGVSAISAAPGDLNTSYVGDRDAVEKAIQTILAACKEFKVICAVTAGPNDVERRIKEGFNLLIGGDDMIRVGHKAAGR